MMRHLLPCTLLLALAGEAGAQPAPTRASTSRVVTRATLSPTLRAALDSGRLHVVRADSSTVLSRDTSRFMIQPGTFLAVRETGDVRTERRRQAMGMTPGSGGDVDVRVLPIRYEGQATDGANVSLRPALIVESPLRYAHAEKAFVGTFLIALDDALAPRVRRPLGSPISITIVSDADSVAPREVDLLQTNTLQRVAVVAGEPQDSVRVRIVPAFDLRAEVTTWLPVQPSLTFSRLPARVAGLGVQWLDVTVTVRGDSRRDSVRVALNSDRGSFVPAEVVVPRGGHATARLRTDGIGPATMTATSPGIGEAEATIQYTWPVAFLLLSLVGGAAGAVSAQLSRSRRGRPRAMRRIVAGSVLGFVAAVAYFGLGVSVLGISIGNQLFNQTAVFGIALFGGALGIPALEATKARKLLAGQDGGQ